MKKFSFISIGIGLSLLLSACANFNSIYRNSEVGGSKARIISVDAKQRNVLFVPVNDTTSGTTFRVCAEAAPDVFSAFATSFGAKGSKSGGELSLASAEAAATIERTQTINLLRESFYRTCERYASGAINRTQFVIQAARDQRSMNSVLAIEQLTGALRAKATVLNGPPTAASTFSGAEAAALVRDYNDRLKTAEAAQETARSALDKAKKSGGVCADGDKKDPAACTALESDLASTTAAKEKAQAGLDNATVLAKNLTTGTLANAGGGTSLQGGDVTWSDINKDALAAIAPAVASIFATSGINESLMFCIGFLSSPDESALNTFYQYTDAKDGKSNLGKLVEGCLTMISEQQKFDNKLQTASLVGLQLTPTYGDNDAKLLRYLDPKLPPAERKRRTDLVVAALKKLGFDSTPTGVMKLIVEGPDELRGLVIAEVVKTEKDPDALKALQTPKEPDGSKPALTGNSPPMSKGQQ
jgi:hypothetical protein